MTPASPIDTAAAAAGRRAGWGFWLQHAGYGLLLVVAIVVLEFAYYYPLVSMPDKLGIASLASLFITWCGEGVVLALTVALFERRAAPRPLGAGQLALAIAVGSVVGVVAWQAFAHLVLRERFGIWLFPDHAGQPVNLAGAVLYHIWLMLLFGGLAGAVHASWQRHAQMLRMLRAAEVGRETSQRQLAKAELVALQAHIDPEFLLQTLTKLEHLYETDPPGADRLLEELIVFLRRALADIQALGAPAAFDRARTRDGLYQAKGAFVHDSRQ